MPRYVIERTIPGADNMTPNDMRAATAHCVEALRNLGPEVQWLQSYVTPDKLYCLYLARDSEIVLRHAKLAGFPADRICEVKAIIDPTTAESAD